VSTEGATSRQQILVEYNSALQQVLAETRFKRDAREALVTFVVRLGGVIWVHPALVTALLSECCENLGFATEPPTSLPDEEFVDFDQLVKTLTALLNKHWAGRRGHPDHTVHAAEMYLAGWLFWMLMHKDESYDDAAAYLLYQVL
jgi:hypothetical protein